MCKKKGQTPETRGKLMRTAGGPRQKDTRGSRAPAKTMFVVLNFVCNKASHVVPIGSATTARIDAGTAEVYGFE